MNKLFTFILLIALSVKITAHANDLISKGEIDLENYQNKYTLKYYIKNSPFWFASNDEYLMTLDPEMLSESYYVLSIYEKNKKIAQSFQHLHSDKIIGIDKLSVEGNKPELIRLVSTPGGNAPSTEYYYIYNEPKNYLQKIDLPGIPNESKLIDLNKDGRIDFCTCEDLKEVNKTLGLTGIERYYLDHYYNFDFETYKFKICDQLFPKILSKNKRLLNTIKAKYLNDKDIVNQIEIRLKKDSN